jgi:hypothetical protein
VCGWVKGGKERWGANLFDEIVDVRIHHGKLLAGRLEAVLDR